MGEQVLAGLFLMCIAVWGVLTAGVAAFGLFLVHLAARDPERPSAYYGMKSTPYMGRGSTR